MAIANQIRSGAPAPGVHLGDSAFIGVRDRRCAGVRRPGRCGGATGAAGRPAGQTGLRVGDLITAVDGAAVNSAADLSNIVDGHRPGDTVILS